MGLANPRPAMRGREERIIRLKLTYHSLRTGDLIAAGWEHKAASTEAMCSVRLKDFFALDRKLRAQAKREHAPCR